MGKGVRPNRKPLQVWNVSHDLLRELAEKRSERHNEPVSMAATVHLALMCLDDVLTGKQEQMLRQVTLNAIRAVVADLSDGDLIATGMTVDIESGHAEVHIDNDRRVGIELPRMVGVGR